jgi:SAM-dependent methyltransferase
LWLRATKSGTYSGITGPLYDAAVPERVDENTETAAVSADEVAAIVARLREEVARPGMLAAANGDSRRAARLAARAQAERFWLVSAERPLERRPGPKGALLHPVKAVLRKLMRFYVEPLAAEQRAFNDASLKLADATAEELDRAEASRTEVERLLRELEERLLRLERRPAAPLRGSEPQSPTVAAQPAQAVLPDYFAFESRMRASTDEIRRRQRPYVDDFRDAAPVLDAGCGRGEFLGLLREAGIEARGVDADADMVAFARGEGLDVEQNDVIAHLDGLDDGALGGVFAAQLVEHLPPAVLLRFLELAHAKLRPGGVLVAETINPLSPLALRNYFADLTHAQPLVPETLALLARHAGFADVETRFLNAPDPVEGIDPRLNEILFAPLDYAIVARR